MIKVAGGIILAIIMVTVVIPIACGMCVIGGSVAMEEHAKEKQTKQKATVAASAPSGKSIMYKDNCNVRSRPGGSKIGVARKLQAYPVVKSKGRWKKIRLSNGREGWTGCKDTK
jgi:uncharacterized protein YgiM (DUF1202 family)